METTEKTDVGEIRALARLMMVDEKELLDTAQIVQPGLASLDDMGFHTFYYLKGILLGKQYEAEEEEDEEEEEEDTRTDDEKWWSCYLANREDQIEARDIDRAIEKGWL